MICIDKKENCCGCTACYNICPKKAISMKEDEEGFLYPNIDKSKCIDCGLCDRICPIKNKKENNIEPKAYSMRVKDKEILKRSTSGGFFTPLAKYVLDNSGIVFGVGYDDKFNVVHKEINKIDDIKELVGSKYVQSYLGDTFKRVKDYLDKGKIVLFSGTPCQIEGLRKYLDKEYDNLIIMDLICHGTPSAKLWKKYITYQEKKYKSKIQKAYFRNKTYGYHSGTMKLVFENGKVYYGSARVDFMLKSFFKEISSRPSCYNCNFKSRKHNSDFTVFDCWHISNYVKNIKDDDKGYTNVIVNSKKAQQILEKIKDNITLYEVDLNEIIRLDGSMVENSTKPHEKRFEFYRSLDNVEIEETIQKYIPISKMDRVIEESKNILFRLGFINFARTLKVKFFTKK